MALLHESSSRYGSMHRHRSSRLCAALTIPLFLLFCVGVSSAQRSGLREDVSELFSYGDDYFLEVAILPSADTLRVRCLVLFRFTYDLLEFRRETSGRAHTGGFLATPSLFVEAETSDGVIVGRGAWSDTVRVDSFRATNARDRFVCGSIALFLKPGRVAVRYSFDNGRPGSGFTRATGPLDLDDPRSLAPAIAPPIFLREGGTDTLRLEAIDGNARFGRAIHCYIPIFGRIAPTSVRYRLLQVLSRPEPPLDIVAGAALRLAPATVGAPVLRGSAIDLPVIRGESESGQGWGASIELPTDDLSPGEYMLITTAEGPSGQSVDTAVFQLRWIDSPFSLSRVDYAIRALYPIATDDQIDRMLSGDRRRQEEALNIFWAERDPSPATRYNEAMAEYYRRVDYSFFNFRTIDRRDGVTTDRGKIYILNGPPTEVTRQMHPSAPPREIWVYRNRVGMVFTFTDEGRNGDYRLVEYRAL